MIRRAIGTRSRSPALRLRYQRSLAGLLLLVAALPCLAAEAEGEDAKDERAAQVETMLRGVFDRIWKVASSQTDGMQKRDAIESLLAEHLDYAALARGALGPMAERFDREEYTDFAREYARYVTWLLVQRTADATQPAELLEVRLDPDKGIVRALALGRDRRRIFMFQRNQPEGRSELRLVLRQRYGAWRVVGLAIDAIDVTKLFREQFQSVLERSEPAALIEDLQRRNRENEDIDPFASRSK
jgi:ABC-type transporter MlaC component